MLRQTFSEGEILWFESTEQCCHVFFLCLPSSLNLNFSKGKKRNYGRKGWGEWCHKVLTCIYFSLCWQPTCMLHIQPHFQYPSEIIPSLSLKNFKRKTKTKTSSIKILQTSRHSQALAKECSGAFPLQLHYEWTIPVTIKNSPTLDMDEVSGADWSSSPVTEKRRRKFFSGLSAIGSPSKTVGIIWRRQSHLPSDGGKAKGLGL